MGRLGCLLQLFPEYPDIAFQEANKLFHIAPPVRIPLLLFCVLCHIQLQEAALPPQLCDQVIQCGGELPQGYRCFTGYTFGRFSCKGDQTNVLAEIHSRTCHPFFQSYSFRIRKSYMNIDRASAIGTFN